MILGIESSCDESAVCLFDPKRGIISEKIHTQIKIHQEYGGIVPDLASREHLVNLPLLLKAFYAENDLKQIKKIAVTSGPGLAGCLSLGISAAKAIGIRYGIPVVGVNHLIGHAFSPFIKEHEKNPEDFRQTIQSLLPHLGLIVSGGNTILFSINRELKLKILAETVDDAAGEALDKGAKLLGYNYPGGPLIEKIALNGNRKAYDFPRSFLNTKEGRFSFSGLKTSLRYQLEKLGDDELAHCEQDICASYQQAVIDALVGKTEQFIKRGNWKSLGLSGGVANNQSLRTNFSALARKKGLELFIAERQHSGDNASMIAFAAYLNPYACHGMDTQFNLTFDPSWPLVESTQTHE